MSQNIIFKEILKRKISIITIFFSFLLFSFILWFQSRSGSFLITPKEYLMGTNNLITSVISLYVMFFTTLFFANDFSHGYIFLFIEALKTRRNYYKYKLRIVLCYSLCINILIILSSLIISIQFKSALGILIENKNITFTELFLRNSLQQIPIIFLLCLVNQIGALIGILLNDNIFFTILTEIVLWVSSAILNSIIPIYKYLFFYGTFCFFEYENFYSILYKYLINIGFLCLLNIIFFIAITFVIEHLDLKWKISVK